MAAVSLSFDAAKCLINRIDCAETLDVACINSNKNVTLSGDSDGISKVLEQARKEGIFARKLRSGNRAYHSHHMRAVADMYENSIRAEIGCIIESPSPVKQLGIENTSQKVRIVSTVRNDGVEAHTWTSPAYWRENLESPVRFSSAFEHIDATAPYSFVEIGPHPALEVPFRENRLHKEVNDSDWHYLPTLQRNKDSVHSILQTLGNLWISGFNVSFTEVNQNGHVSIDQIPPSERAKLPLYQWQHDRILWSECRTSSEYRFRRHVYDELLGGSIPGTSTLTWSWRNMLNLSNASWLQHHKIDGVRIMPAAAYITMASRAAQQLCSVSDPYPAGLVEVSDIYFIKAMTLVEQESLEVITELKSLQVTDVKTASDYWSFDIITVVNGNFTRHATGKVRVFTSSYSHLTPIRIPDRLIRSRGDWFAYFSVVGLNYEKEFECAFDNVYCGIDDESKTIVATCMQDDRNSDNTALHQTRDEVATIDSMIQCAVVANAEGSVHNVVGQIPTFIEKIHIMTEPFSRLKARIVASAESVGFGVAKSRLNLLDDAGQTLVSMQGARMMPFKGQKRHEAKIESTFTRIDWKPDISFATSNLSHTLETYIRQSLDNDTNIVAGTNISVWALAYTIDLLTHKNSSLSILVVYDAANDGDNPIRKVIDADNVHTRSATVEEITIEQIRAPHDGQASFPEDGYPIENAAHSGRLFDIVVLCQAESTLPVDPLQDTNNGVRSGKVQPIVVSQSLQRLAACGFLLSNMPCELSVTGEVGGYQTDMVHLSDSQTISVVSKMHMTNGRSLVNDECSKPVYLVSHPALDNFYLFPMLTKNEIVNKHNDLFGNSLMERLSSHYATHIEKLTVDSLMDICPKKHCVVVSAIEINHAVLSTCSPETWSCLKKVFQAADIMLWVSAAGTRQLNDPEHGTTMGLFRVLAVEEPSLRATYVLVEDMDLNCEITIRNLMAVLQRTEENDADKEYIQRDGLLHCSRLYPDSVADSEFNNRKERQPIMREAGEVGLCRLSLGQPSDLNSVRFTQLDSPIGLKKASVLVSVRSVGLNAKASLEPFRFCP